MADVLEWEELSDDGGWEAKSGRRRFVASYRESEEKWVLSYYRVPVTSTDEEFIGDYKEPTLERAKGTAETIASQPPQ